MNNTRWRRVEDLFTRACEVDPEARRRMLQTECGDDALLRAEVESLLDRAERAEAFLEAPIAPDAPRVLKSLAGIDDALLGVELAGWIVDGVVASGGMGTVYRAHAAVDTERVVAVKVMRPGLDVAAVSRRFQREGELLASLDHPSIARFVQSGVTADGRPFYVMEYVDGAPLLEACDRARMPIEARLHLFCAVGAAVAHAHRQLIVHRDLKPGNILVDSRGRPRLVDFGIATVLSPASAVRRQTRVMTPEYTSPEQARGEMATTASDIYSLGMVLYELLTGQAPYAFSSYDVDTIAKVASEAEPARPSQLEFTAETAECRGTVPSKLRRQLRDDLDNIVRFALRKEPERRYATVEHFVEDVRRHLAGQPIAARPDTLLYRAAKFVRRNRLAASLAAVLLVAVGLGLVGVVWQARVARQESRNSQRVTELLLEVLGGNGGHAATTTARELVDRAARRLDRLSDLPVTIRAALEHALGRMYFNLGDYVASVRFYEASLRARVAQLGADDPRTAATRVALAVTLSRTNEVARSDAELVHALATARSAGDESLVGDALDALGCLRNTQGRKPEAEQMLREALRLRRRTHGPVSEPVVSTMNNLATVCWALGDLEETGELLRGALALHRQMGDSEDQQVEAQLTHNLGVLHMTRGEHQHARDCFDAALALRRTSLPDGHPRLADTLDVLARLELERGDPCAAEDFARQCLTIRERALPDHWFTDDTRSLLAASLIEQQRWQEAETLLRSALPALRHKCGDTFDHTQEAFERLARVCEHVGHDEEAAGYRASLREGGH
ncbi:MAG: serine/threonine-protein kinase [Planctomycetota bacterium]